MSDIQKILELLQELEVFLKEHGDNSVANEQKILKK